MKAQTVHVCRIQTEQVVFTLTALQGVSIMLRTKAKNSHLSTNYSAAINWYLPNQEQSM